MNKKNNKMRNRLLAFSLAFALCMGAFAGFTMTTHAASNAYNTLKASVKRVNTVLGDIYEFDGYTDETIYPLLDQLSESEWTTLKNETTIDGISPLDRYGTSKADYNTRRYFATHPSDEAIPGYQNNQNASNENNNSDSYSSWQMNDDAITTKMSGGEIVNGSKLGFCENYDFVKLPVGSEFQSSDGRIFRVTKEMGYRSFGEVQLIGYGSTDTEDVQHFGDGGDGILRAASNTALDIGDAITPNGNRYKDPNIDELRRNRRNDNEAYKAALRKQNDSITFNKYTESKNYIDIGNMLADISFGRDAKTGEQYYTYHSVYFVTSIKSGAFKNNKDLEEVWIPQTVSEIPKECFSGCTNLKTVHWGTNTLKNLKGDEFFSKASVKYNSKRKIAVKAFNGCKKLSTFYLVGSDKDIKVEKNAFKNCKTITVKSYKKNKYAKKFAKAISSKGKAKKNASLTNKKVTGMTDDGQTSTIKAKSKKK
jgi:hypothetical protein